MKPTRRERAEQLLDILKVGPGSKRTPHEIQLWINSCIIPAVKTLVPELRDRARRTAGNTRPGIAQRSRTSA